MENLNTMIGNNLRIERERHGISRTSLANALNIKRAVLDAYEGGKLEFEEDFIEQAASALRCKESVFFKVYKPLNNARFRAKKSLNSREAILNDCSEHLQDYISLEDFLGRRTDSKLDAIRKIRSDSDIASFAISVRRFLNMTDDEPVVDVCKIAELCGVKLVPFDCEDTCVSGLSSCDGETGPVLFLNVNSSISVEHKRFSFAHELGHLLLHTGDYRNDCDIDEVRCEKEANEFASFFLMPKNAFDDCVEKTRGLPIFSMVMRIKNNFGVSCTSVLYRLGAFYKRSLDAHFANAFKRQTGKNFVKTEEPFPMSEADFGTQKIKSMVREAFEKELITMSRGAEILNCSLSEMRCIVSEWV